MYIHISFQLLLTLYYFLFSISFFSFFFFSFSSVYFYVHTLFLYLMLFNSYVMFATWIWSKLSASKTQSEYVHCCKLNKSSPDKSVPTKLDICSARSGQWYIVCCIICSCMNTQSTSSLENSHTNPEKSGQSYTFVEKRDTFQRLKSGPSELCYI